MSTWHIALKNGSDLKCAFMRSMGNVSEVLVEWKSLSIVELLGGGGGL